MNTLDIPWWNKHLNVIQTNLQVADTDKIDPVRLAGQISAMHGDALIFNVGGIYAWYDSKVKYHHVNEYLGDKRDLVGQVIRECHRHGIKFIARYDFNLAHDDVFGEHPEWFTQDNQRRPSIPGAFRPGNWDLLYHICINGGYRNEDVALPVLAESLEEFDLDGIFLNGPFPNPCWCDNCRRKYMVTYGVPLPQEAADIDPTWRNLQYRENLTKFNDLIKSRRPDIPLILYVMFNHVLENGLPADLLCDETRDSLSEGVTSTWQPAIRMKRCALKSHKNPTWGFVHSAPGLDWRHVGLPPAEYRFWLSQLPANGATLVHSLTGVPDTIPDKRILEIVARSNERAAKVYPAMDLAVEYADVAILWNEDNHPKAWMDVFAGLGLPFILIDKDRMTTESLKDIRLVVLPEGISLDTYRMDLLEKHVTGGASLLYEGSIPDNAARLSTLLGVQPGSVRSPFLKASYLRFEQPGDFLQEEGLENTAIIALNGEVSYCRPSTAIVLATLVPPYVPDAAAGTPPERASIRTEQTEIPMVLLNTYGTGKAACLSFSLSAIISRYGMFDHLLVMKNLIAELVETPLVEIPWTQGLNVTLYKGPEFLLIHLLNCAGTRPLVHTLPLCGIEVSVRIPEARSVQALIAGTPVDFTCTEGLVKFQLDSLDEWECIKVSI